LRSEVAPMAGKLTTHVLDTAQGCPAANMTIELWSVQAQTGEKTLLKTIHTNADGRTDAPVLSESEMQVGVYELVFEVGAYFTHQSVKIDEPAFLDRVPLQFGIADSQAHYHVPLLVSPWAYSTYRGS
jgi:5-hydroxyisourate hydrolase